MKYLCIFDKNLQNTAKVEQLTANWQKTGSEGKSDLVVEFKNSKAVMEIFSKIPGAACAYVVEITPPVEEVSTMWTTKEIGYKNSRYWTKCSLEVTPYNDRNSSGRLYATGKSACAFVQCSVLSR